MWLSQEGQVGQVRATGGIFYGGGLLTTTRHITAMSHTAGIPCTSDTRATWSD